MAQKNGQLREGYQLAFANPWNCPIPAHSMKAEIRSSPKILIALHIADGYRLENHFAGNGHQAILKYCRMAPIRSALFNLLFPKVVFNEPRIEGHSELSSGNAARNVLRSSTILCAR